MINIGNIKIGGNYIPIQTMLKNPVTEIEKTLQKINNVAKLGCDIIRITVPEEKVIPALKEVIIKSPIPIVADIHFDYKLAILAIEAGVHKVRINPGNIGDEAKVKKVIDCLKVHNIPVRIGINGGSLPKHLKEKYNDNTVKIMLESAKEEIAVFEKYGFDKLVLSFKSSNVLETIEVNRKAKKEFGLPLHIGVTEAGDLIDGTIKNTAGITNLLLDGIGDTIRVSLTSKEEDEILVGKKILESIGKRTALLEIISCPTCGRTQVNIQETVRLLKEKTQNIMLKNKVKIAVMGCIVNGPGEAESANFGVACGKGQSLIFKDGKKIKTVKNSEILDELLIILKDYYE
jgi:(E)-4-hydroxy-3-methylbut-2-enyl-diphosphate synthase